MNNTMALFAYRKEEIEFYFSVMKDIENKGRNIKTIDNSRLIRIMKSNLLLMLYNIVEACIVNGINEIYESLSCIKYSDLIDEIQDLWVAGYTGSSYDGGMTRDTVKNVTKQVIDYVVKDRFIQLNKGWFKLSGNLDARKIYEICVRHGIRHEAEDRKSHLLTVKKKRQSLAHGDESFGDCARDFTLDDLEGIKDTVLEFIAAILKGMEEYYNNKLYLRNPNDG